jgi:imidazolonepropionase-like amidohydrolase
LIDEIVALHELGGLTPYEALATATRNAGRFVRAHVDVQASFGTVRVGARADLLLLSDDPRTDFDVLRHPEGVMVRGRWLDAGALQRLLPTPAERADPDRD